MVIELIGTRIIAPFYGASLYVWSSLISTTMIALAAGYFIGGRWTDRSQTTGLSLIIALAGILTLLIPGLARSVLLATDPLGLRAGAFVSALALFSPSLTFLGMAGPFAIRLTTSHLEGVGSSSGSIYAVSTLGSVAGTILLGFFLFPVLGSREILIGTGVILLMVAILLSIYEQKRLKIATGLLPCVSITVIGLSLIPYIADAGQSHSGNAGKYRILFQRESLYGWVRVIEQPAKDLRLLTSDASAIGAASIRNGTNRLGYQKFVDLIPLLKPGMNKALLIGLGAGHMAKTLDKEFGIVTDTLEIDPEVARAAREYFGFKPTGQAIVGDARYEIRRLKGPYDFIILDCFTGGTEPSHLLTVETLLQLRDLLSYNGLIILNFVAFAEDGNNRALASVAKTIAQVFKHQSVFISEPGTDFNDFVLIAGSEAIELKASSLMVQDFQWLQARQFIVNQNNGGILTDNLNPLEKLQTRKSEQYRQLLVEWLGPDILIR
ncbi:MAG: fused MFS/spermidine synthase [Methylococcaceae bacterium]|nr:fused MFS/spermidine synthase [Methylococcaceae bacterium]